MLSQAHRKDRRGGVGHDANGGAVDWRGGEAARRKCQRPSRPLPGERREHTHEHLVQHLDVRPEALLDDAHERLRAVGQAGKQRLERGLRLA